MNKIEEQIKKFLLIKQKISSTEKETLSKFSQQSYYSVLSYINKKKINISHKNPQNNVPNSNHNITDKSSEQKQKEKNKFSVVSELYDKKKYKTLQGKNHLNSIEQNSDKEQNSPKKELTLLDIENNNIGGRDLSKIFAKREKEEKKVNKEQENIEENEAVNEENKEEKERENINFNELSFDNDDKDKNNEINGDVDDKLNNNINLDLRNFQSGINEPHEFEIFDTTKIKEQKDEMDDLIGNNDDDSERNGDTCSKKNSLNEAEEKMIIEEENKEEIKEEKIEFKKPTTTKKEKEKEKETKRSSSKICIPLDEKEKDKEKINEKHNDKNKVSKPPQSSKTSKTQKINSDNKNTNNINNINTNIKNKDKEKEKDKNLLKKKTNRISQSEARPSPNIINKEINPINPFTQKNPNSSKSKTKIIDDDEDEEFSSKKKKPQKNNTTKKKEESLVTGEGSKISINFGDIIESDIKTNKKNNSPKDISINIESAPEKKGTNNNIHINNNNNNIVNNYDMTCLDNINSILEQINEKLKNEKKEFKENNSMQKCFNLINEIKKGEYNFNNLIKRKKDTYINVFKLLKILFYFFSENNISKNFLNEIVAICISVQKYYKNVKDLDNSINKMDNFYNRKLYFKYAFSKLELRNYDKQNLKELLSNYHNNEINNSSTNNNTDKMVKFIKITKRYLKTSLILLKEAKTNLDNIKKEPKNESNSKNIEKYEIIYKDIRSSSHVMAYNRLFRHFYYIFSLLDEPQKKEEETKKKENHDERKKGKSMQVHKNGIQNKREASMSNIKSKNNK